MTAADVEKFRAIFDLCDFGVRIYRQRMVREHPGATDDEIDDLVQDWLSRPTNDIQLRRPARRR